MTDTKEKWISAGGVIVRWDETSPDPLFCVILPSNDWGPWSFPKGRRDPGEGLQTTALREVREETGIKARIVQNGYLGYGHGKESITHYWLMEYVATEGQHDFETQEVRWVTYEEALRLFSAGSNTRDVNILNRALAKIETLNECHIRDLIRNLLF